MNLKPCPLCAGKPVVISRGSFHLSCVKEDDDDESAVEWIFLNDRAIMCSNCMLTMPEFDPEHPNELEEYWNSRV